MSSEDPNAAPPSPSPASQPGASPGEKTLLPRPKPSSSNFYRQLLLSAAREDPLFEMRVGAGVPQQQPPPSSDSFESPAEGSEQRSYFACPCCAKLFHVFEEDGRLHTVAARGQLEDARVKFVGSTS
eukprot:TRINITY_DN95891_c0_g1_i1.p2 TRINITY_DN95891_c0_g1~~TRINITY_DN95891_c0_g1_i1.p2  ORF type:complete len:127 (+),score=20.49 TRINITY_DN95891_c0_g1_i1:146-526(+)